MDAHEAHPQALPASNLTRREERGARLAQARQHAGLNQEEAGKALGVPKYSISRWERGLHEAAFIYVERLAELYCVSLDWVSGKALHRIGLKPGYTIVDVRALETLRNARDRGGTLEDIDEILRPPGPDIAWDLPEELMLLDRHAAGKLKLEIQQGIEKLKRKKP